MKVDKIITPIVRDTVENGIKTAEKVVENPIKEFNDVAGDIAGRAKLGMDNATLDLTQIRADIEKTLRSRHFCPKTISYITAFLKPENARALQTLAHDPYASSRPIEEFACFATKENSAFLEQAAKMRDYEAAQDVKRGFRKELSEVKDMRTSVEENYVPYNPKWNAKALALTNEELLKAQNEIIDNLKNRGISNNTINYVKSWIKDDSVDVIRLASMDKNIADHEMCLWACHANAENADLMIRALLTKQYGLERRICDGTIRNMETIDAWYAYRNMLKSGKIKINTGDDAIFMAKTFENKITDKYSDFLQLIFEDQSLSLDTLIKIFKNLSNENKNALKEAYLRKDFETMEKIIGEKFNPREIDFIREGAKQEFKTTSSTGKITRNDFIRYMDDKLTHTSDFDVSQLKDSEVRNLAKLFGTTEEQIRNMSKKEYRRLCIQTHPDRNPNDNMSNQVFRILNKIFLGR